MTLTCLIPAYNEAARIAAVLTAVLDHPLIDEVIVIDDGSTDGTAQVAAQVAARYPKARLIALPHNIGKTAALAQGLRQASGDLILLLDADLSGLSPHHLTALITPVRDGHADLSISLRANAPALWRWIGLDYISGERVLHKSLLTPHHDTLKTLPKFGFEVFLNSLAITHHARISVTPWPEVASPLKSQKYGLWAGVKADVRMLRDLFQAVPEFDAELSKLGK